LEILGISSPAPKCRVFCVSSWARPKQLKRYARLADDALEAYCAREAMSKLPITVVVLTGIVVSQYLWIFLAHRRNKKREALFRIITENAADMIALVDTKGRRLYNSPSYERVLGYSPRIPRSSRDRRGQRSAVPFAAQERRLADSGIYGEHHQRTSAGTSRNWSSSTVM